MAAIPEIRDRPKFYGHTPPPYPGYLSRPQGSISATSSPLKILSPDAIASYNIFTSQYGQQSPHYGSYDATASASDIEIYSRKFSSGNTLSPYTVTSPTFVKALHTKHINHSNFFIETPTSANGDYNFGETNRTNSSGSLGSVSMADSPARRPYSSRTGLLSPLAIEQVQ